MSSDKFTEELEAARLKACELLNEAAHVLTQAAGRSVRVSCVLAEISLAWKHTRDLNVGNLDERP